MHKESNKSEFPIYAAIFTTANNNGVMRTYFEEMYCEIYQLQSFSCPQEGWLCTHVLSDAKIVHLQMLFTNESEIDGISFFLKRSFFEDCMHGGKNITYETIINDGLLPNAIIQVVPLKQVQIDELLHTLLVDERYIISKSSNHEFGTGNLLCLE